MTEVLFAEDLEADVLAVPVFAERVWGPGAEEAVAFLGDTVDQLLDARDFTGKSGQIATIPADPDGPYAEVMLVGIGAEVDAEVLRRASGSLAKAVGRRPVAATTLHQVDLDGAVSAVVLGFLLGAYRFDKYRSEPKPRHNERLVLLGAGDQSEVAEAEKIAAGVVLARDLINEPAFAKPPLEIAERISTLAEGVTVEIIDEAGARERGFGGLLAVSAGAASPSCMAILRYEPADAVGSLALVGKGIVFDSGGLSLKTTAGMETMKTDMAGAAAVFGAIKAIADLELPVRLIGITPLTENMPGGAAQRPGDVLTAYNGKTIEVLNTDAEGRLVLADALALAAESSPDLIVDVATLTGASKVALGPKIGSLFGNDDRAAAQVESAAAFAGEKVWRLPLESEYRSMIDSDVADMKNSGERWGGAITAALLLQEFVGDTPWVHLDVAGPARAGKDENYVTKGGTGFGVRTLVALAQQVASDGAS
jgi:leucyl aminopeptidase